MTLSKRISASSSALSSWVDLLRWRVTQQPEQRAYTFLTDGEIERDHLSYADLDSQARVIGALPAYIVELLPSLSTLLLLLDPTAR